MRIINTDWVFDTLGTWHSNAYRFIVTGKSYTVVQTYPWPLKSLSGEKKEGCLSVKSLKMPSTRGQSAHHTRWTCSKGTYILPSTAFLATGTLYKNTEHYLAEGWHQLKLDSSPHYIQRFHLGRLFHRVQRHLLDPDRKKRRPKNKQSFNPGVVFIDHCLNLPLYPAAPLVHGHPWAQSLQAAPVDKRHSHIGGSESYYSLDLSLISHNSFHVCNIVRVSLQIWESKTIEIFFVQCNCRHTAGGMCLWRLVETLIHSIVVTNCMCTHCIHCCIKLPAAKHERECGRCNVDAGRTLGPKFPRIPGNPCSPVSP